MVRRVHIGADEARRIAFAAQGFDRPRPASPTDIRHFRRAMRAINVLQLDFVNVLMPAHFLMIWSRLGGYDRTRFESWLYSSGEYTEQWAHEASIVSCDDWPLLAPRRAAYQQHKNSPLRRLRNHKQYLENALQQVREQGALTSNDLPPVPGPPRKQGDWHRSIPRWALEKHFGCGDLGVQRRLGNFQRVYDLPERLLPAEMLNASMPPQDAQRELVRKSIHALGIGTLQDIADYYRLTPTKIATTVKELVAAGEAQEVRVEHWSATALLSRYAQAPRAIPGASLLSPFDPMVWFRPRSERLFNFEYRIEIYVPAAKRRWGYYVLPFREGDQITARIDLKADRKESCLLIQAAHAESTSGSSTVARLAIELRQLAAWLGLKSIDVKKASTFEHALATELA